MPRLVAFLRGINVGGHQLVKMDQLTDQFEAAGATDVSTYKASGNVAFTWRSGTLPTLGSVLASSLRHRSGASIEVMIRSLARLEEILRSHPYPAVLPEGDTPYVTFFATMPRTVIAAPRRSPKGDVDVLRVDGTEAFSLSRRVDGRPGFPNLFLERLSGVAATTRNWSTVQGIVEREETAKSVPLIVRRPKVSPKGLRPPVRRRDRSRSGT